MKDDRTLDDLSEEEYEDCLNHPDDWEEVIDNTIEDNLDMMYPDGMDEDE